MDALVLLYDYFEDRAAAAALIRRRRPLALGVLGVLLGGTSLFVAKALAGRLLLLDFSWPSLLTSLLWQSAVLLSLTALLHLLLDLGGARGDAGALFVHLGLSELAWLAAVPAVLLARAVLPAAGPGLVLAAAGVWSLALKARALSDEYGVGSGRAWLTLALPGLALAALLALTAALAVARALRALGS